MHNINPLLLIDFYKSTHAEQYPENTAKIVSYYTPRASKLKDQDKLVMFGLQGYIKYYLIESFNQNFFSRPKKEAVGEYKRYIQTFIKDCAIDFSRIEKLHDLGYLPLLIRAVPEGTRVPVRVPMFEISNTHPDFYWLTNTIESSVQCSLWHMMTAANVGYNYRKIVEKYFDLSVDDTPYRYGMGDFSFRGQDSVESAVKCAAAWALSFVNTATVPAGMYLERYYGANIETDEVIRGTTSFEHSTTCSNYAVNGSEKTTLKNFLEGIYKNTNFTYVADSYDYWDLIENIVPEIKREILSHNGYIGFRGDSGDPIEIVTRTVFKLWDIFGGRINSKGFKVLAPQVKAVYGDSITYERTKEIFEILTKNKFACSNAVLCSGSLSMQCLEESGKSKPYTRDTFGVAVKAAYCEINGGPVFIFKDPKTDDEKLKRSQKGCCVVLTDKNGELYCEDGYDFDETFANKNKLTEVFKDGKIIKEYNLNQIRGILHEGKF